MRRRSPRRRRSRASSTSRSGPSIGHDGLESLIASGACDSLGSSRRALLWELGLVPRSQSVPGSGGEERQLALPLDPTAETPELAEPTEWEQMLAELPPHEPLGRRAPDGAACARISPPGVLSSHDLCQAPDRSRVAVAGMAVARQRPSTAKGVVFMLLEDEFGQVNLIVPPQVYERHRAIVRGEPLILARGVFERVGAEPERRRPRARDARAARAQALRRARPRLGSPGRAPLRPPLGSPRARSSSSCSWRRSLAFAAAGCGGGG